RAGLATPGRSAPVARPGRDDAGSGGADRAPGSGDSRCGTVVSGNADCVGSEVAGARRETTDSGEAVRAGSDCDKAGCAAARLSSGGASGCDTADSGDTERGSSDCDGVRLAA